LVPVGRVGAAQLTPAQQRLIMRDNLRKLAGLPA
jgi:hypothetical protein